MSLACGLATKASHWGKESDLEDTDSDAHWLSESRDDGGCLESAVSQSPWCNYKGEASHGVSMSGQPDTHTASCHREWLIIVFTLHIRAGGRGAVLHNRLHL